MTISCGIKFRDSSWAKFEKVIDLVGRASDGWREPTSFKVNDQWYSKRVFSYYADKLVDAGLCERKRHYRGWYTWTTYHLVLSTFDTWTSLTGLPF